VWARVWEGRAVRGAEWDGGMGDWRGSGMGGWEIGEGVGWGDGRLEREWDGGLWDFRPILGHADRRALIGLKSLCY
jgi:hypothetical protein